jgi:hypothetical protein
MKHSLLAGAAGQPLSFAHLLGGLGRKSAARRAEDDKPEDDKDAARAESEDEEDDKDKDAARAEDDDKDKDAARAEDEGDDAVDEDDKDAKRGRKAKSKAEDDDEKCAEEDDDDDAVAEAAQAGRRAERARCRKIFSTKAAGERPDVAAQLAFTTNLSSAEAIGILTSAASGGAAPRVSRRIDDRMSRVVIPPIGSDASPAPGADTPKGKAAAIVAAMNKARGGK